MWSQEFTPKKKWSEDKTMNFVREYRVNDCLWDVNHKDYKNRRVREIMCSKMAEKFNCTSDDVRRKIKSLRGAYCHERNKIKESIGSTFDVDNVYVPSVIWYDEMDAVMNGASGSEVENSSNNLSETIENTDNEHQSGDDDNEQADRKGECSSNNDASDDERTSEISLLDRSSKMVEQTSKSADTISSADSAFHKMNSSSLSMIRKKKKDQSVNLFKAIDKLHSISARSDDHGLQDNEFDLFGRFVAQQLKNFKDLKTALRVQHKIHGMLSEERIQEMTDTTQECCTSSSSTSQQLNNFNQLRNEPEAILNPDRSTLQSGLSSLIMPVDLESTKFG